MNIVKQTLSFAWNLPVFSVSCSQCLFWDCENFLHSHCLILLKFTWVLSLLDTITTVRMQCQLMELNVSMESEGRSWYLIVWQGWSSCKYLKVEIDSIQIDLNWFEIWKHEVHSIYIIMPTLQKLEFCSVFGTSSLIPESADFVHPAPARGSCRVCPHFKEHLQGQS